MLRSDFFFPLLAIDTILTNLDIWATTTLIEFTKFAESLCFMAELSVCHVKHRGKCAVSSRQKRGPLRLLGWQPWTGFPKPKRPRQILLDFASKDPRMVLTITLLINKVRRKSIQIFSEINNPSKLSLIIGEMRGEFCSLSGCLEHQTRGLPKGAHCRPAASSVNTNLASTLPHVL